MPAVATSTSVGYDISELFWPGGRAARASRSGCSTLWPFIERALHRTTTTSTTCSTGRATARCARPSASACSPSTRCSLLAGGAGHLAQKLDVVARRRSCGRSASCWSCCRCSSAGSAGRCAATCKPDTIPSTKPTSPSRRSRRTRPWHRARPPGSSPRSPARRDVRSGGAFARRRGRRRRRVERPRGRARPRPRATRPVRAWRRSATRECGR